tara:strand:+ start:370 stop:639 length:270 start_codon:yes stop_codon:yes gene_type:complete
MKIQTKLFILLLTGLLSVVGNLALADEAIDKSLSKAMPLEPLVVNIKTAEAIVAFRNDQGLFTDPEFIMAVKGIDDFTFEVNKDVIMVE